MNLYESASSELIDMFAEIHHDDYDILSKLLDYKNIKLYTIKFIANLVIQQNMSKPIFSKIISHNKMNLKTKNNILLYTFVKGML